MKKIFFLLLLILWNLLHIWFFWLNEVMKIADSFAYLQMAHHLKNFSIEWLGNGWFGFLYSLPIAFVSAFIENDMTASFVVNMILFNIFIGISYIFGRNYLQEKYLVAFLWLLFLSPILLHYNIHILSENIYIPLFFILFIGVLQYQKLPSFGNILFLGIMIWFLYLTRAEAFIYIGSIGLILWFLWIRKDIWFAKMWGHFLVAVVWFFLIAFPYMAYMNSFTWEWWLTNKGSSNLRQAQLRGVNKMDDDGFEQAVGELRSDNLWLIAGFAWGLKYEKPAEWESFKNYIFSNPSQVLERIGENQVKLYTQNLPHIILGNAFTLHSIEWSNFFYKNPLFWILLLLPLGMIFWGIIALIKNGEWFMVAVFASFFFVATFFFTLFFVLDRYFVIFVPFFLFFFVYGLQSWKIKNTFWEWGKYIIFSWIYASILALGLLSYYNTFAWEDAKYEVKKEAWEYLSQYHFSGENLRILERFPVVTYYAGTKERWLTPYTDKLENLITYARHHSIDYLVVDSVDFATYRKDLDFLLSFPDERYPWLKKFKEFEKNWQKVILYKIEK